MRRTAGSQGKRTAPLEEPIVMSFVNIFVFVAFVIDSSSNRSAFSFLP